jgi:transcriptional regulator with XRE-family HTH domain
LRYRERHGGARKIRNGADVTAVVQVDVKALYHALDRTRTQHGLSWRQLATKLGVDVSTLTRMHDGRKLGADTAVTLVTWLRMPFEAFIDGGFPDETLELRDRVEALELDLVRERDKRLTAQRNMDTAREDSRKEKVQRDGWELAATSYAKQLAIARQQLIDNGIEPDRRIM